MITWLLIGSLADRLHAKVEDHWFRKLSEFTVRMAWIFRSKASRIPNMAKLRSRICTESSLNLRGSSRQNINVQWVGVCEKGDVFKTTCDSSTWEAKAGQADGWLLGYPGLYREFQASQD